jgi:biotin operon repressor
MSAARLSEDFQVSKRTIERDIQSLQLAGVPIYADHGVSGGYSILREHSLPPLNLTLPESLAVLAGLGLLETSPYGAAARRARAKVLAISREDQLAPVDEALASMFVIDSHSPSEAAVSLIPRRSPRAASYGWTTSPWTARRLPPVTWRRWVCCAEVMRGCSWDGVGCAKASADFSSTASGTWRSSEKCFPNATLRCWTRICRGGALGGSGDAATDHSRMQC